MGKEIDLLINYPKTIRNLDERKGTKSKKVRKIARKFGKDFFDGDRKYGYGGYNYHPRFWSKVVPTFKKYWNLKNGDSILDVGCGKGFMIYDFKRLIKGLNVSGVDISEYAIQNSLDEIKKDVIVGNAKNLPYADKSFDYVISINTIHNLSKEDCAKSLREIQRVSKKGSYITVDAYTNISEKKRMYDWNLTAKTIMSNKEWKKFLKKNFYKGDYFWFIP
jgi:ubiquinone/menaquinone biosynthesis C-methylase UbiE